VATEQLEIDPVDLRTFPPVPALSEIPETWRQTFLAKHAECPRSAYLYLKYNGGALTHPLAGGTLLHRATERYIAELIAEKERMGIPERAKDILNEVLVESTDLTVSPDRFDSLRAMMFHLAEGLRIDPAAVICLESPVSIEVNGRKITGTVDFAELDPRTRVLTVKDWKSAFYNAARSDKEEEDEYVPSKEDWPGTFQLLLYALSIAEGSIEGAPFGLGQIELFRLQQVHPRQWWRSEETMAYREAVISRDALLDWMLYLNATVESVEQAFVDWRWPAVKGNHCDYCPASAECPIPAALRNWRGEIRTPEDAQRAALLVDAFKERAAEVWDGLKGYAKATGRPVRYGRDREYRWKKVESEKVKRSAAPPGTNKKIKGLDALKVAIDLAERTDTPIDFNDYTEHTVSTRLTRKTLTPKELDDEKGSTDGTDY
jgi:hypothetical protein